MRSQSSIEFLTTYSFLFLLLGISVSIILFLSSAPVVAMPSQCTSFAGPTCNFVQLYSNSSAGYSLVTLSLTNSQSVPINITGMSTVVKNFVSAGACTPSLLYPGQQATCVSNVSKSYQTGTFLPGFYTVNAQYCNSGIGAVSSGNCAYEKVVYGGSFSSTTSASRAIVFSVLSAQGPSDLQLLSYNAIKNLPMRPNNFTILQSGDWVGNVTGGVTAYALASNGAMLGLPYFGYLTKLFPQTASSLRNGGVACANPYNSLLSIASTTLYLSSAVTSSVSIEAGGAMEVFYKLAQTGTVWQSTFGGSAWKSQGATAYGPTSITLNKGIYNIEVVWSNPCGAGGQVLKMTNIPN